VRWFRRTPLADARWIVIDCETSGLDPKHDRLLSVGAVSVRGRRIALAEAYGAVLAQAQPSAPENIVIHGIGGEAQRAGRMAREVLRELSEFAADSVPVAFHAPFDAEILKRACKSAGAPALPRRWLDLAQLAPALFADGQPARGDLDDWLARFGIAPQARHDALGDAFAAAQLLLALLDEAARQGLDCAEEVIAVAGAGRWLGSPARG
jgi:DNA polymerase-3 subunit epsilon